ncbi:MULTISPECIES: SPOR domain-containing protein [Pseudomonas]|uniref:Sporulation protein n=1 Tax=Pseudomonas sediminis TaxID=1691904 RepID=A0A2G5FCM3_9PSED|nr:MULTISPECIES: SPOR domain-containing protein [Pseudomonas]MCW1938502.1 SPOR domain-containing protein [Pseudomonas sp. MDMC_285]MDU9410680.1 SPOR domain-containing protein [Pseudomonas sp. zfem001]PIA65727.1 sporulation protein [Pseudomonas sediminis]RRV18967.1 SPOR domain-containing protein [Pseudomonas sp. o96-267]RRV38195.1 SPOR domain-containing protein [Pseudomonas sp. o96-267]
MRWILLLLLLLNAFYYVWHQQQGPLRAKEVAPAGAYQSARKDIRLLSEADAPRVRAESSAPADAVAPEAAVCLYLGSFEEESRARVVEQRLLSLDIQAEVRSVDAAAGVEYWVYLPPLASRQASLRQLRELQARRIDSYIITQGELANGISLGIFPRNDSANSVMQRLRDVGYEPQIRELSRAHRSFWVRVAPESRRLADEFLLGRLAGDFAGLQHQLMPCEGVALLQ